MLVRYVLLTLPVHRRSFNQYYSEHDHEVAARRAELEREWGAPFDELAPHVRLAWKDRFYWPPWYFNDTVGQVKVGSDGDSALTADVFVERRHFSPTALERFGRKSRDGDDEREVVFLASVERHAVTAGDNASYVAACQQVVAAARETVRLQGHGLPNAEVWLPGFDLDCIDMARADRQLRERFPGRTEPR